MSQSLKTIITELWQITVTGRPSSGTEVQPAIQADKPVEYHKYVAE